MLGVRAHAEVQKEIDETRAAYERLKDSGTLTGAELAQAALKTEDRVRELRAQTNGGAVFDAEQRGLLALLDPAALGPERSAADGEVPSVSIVLDNARGQLTRLFVPPPLGVEVLLDGVPLGRVQAVTLGAQISVEVEA